MESRNVNRYVIVGNSAGAIGATEAIRSRDSEGSLTLISEEPYPAYSRPLISEYMTGARTLESIRYRPAEFYEEHRVEPVLGKQVTAVDADARCVLLETGERVEYDHLLLATGGKPFVPPIEDLQNRTNVLSFTTLGDAIAVRRAVEAGVGSAVVIGGGLIGLSAAEALAKRNVRVTIVEMMDRLLASTLDAPSSSIVERAIQDAGVQVLTGHTVMGASEPRGDLQRVDRVLVDPMKTVPCDLVILAAGVVPRVELARTCGLEVNRGILVDEHMTTSRPDIYACGDVAEAYDLVWGERRVTPIWPNAYGTGRIAGLNMAGLPTAYSGSTGLNAVKYFGLSVVSGGLTDPPDDGYDILTSDDAGGYRKLILKDGLLMGFLCVGDIERSGILYGLMRDRIDLSDLKDSLCSSDFGLISLPESLRREWLSGKRNPLTTAA